MRALILIFGVACQVPDKRAPGDGGSDGSNPTGPVDTTITSAPPEFSNDATASFEFKSNYPSARFECRIDGLPPAACTSPFVVPLPDGSHSFSVRALDGADRDDETPAEHLWTIDTVQPNTTLTLTPPAADNSTMVHFEFTSNEENVTFECSLDNAAYVPCRSGDAFGPIGDGAHAFAARAKDRATNIDASPAIFAWSVDTSTPDTQILTGPSGATAIASASFTFDSPDAGAGATFQCSLDASAFAACVSPQDYAGLAEGSHTFAVRVRDSVGNFDPTPATRTWTVDATPPDTHITSGPTGAVGVASAMFTFTSTEPNATFTCSLDGGAMAACTSPYSAMMLPQGPHTFAVAAIDGAGNVDATPATASWTVDTVAPDLAIVAGPNDGEVVGPRVIFMFTLSEGSATCAIDAAAPAPCASPVGYNLPAGMHAFTVSAIDAAGNATSASRTFTVACTPADATGAVGLLHLDDTGQILANATGGANATLGPTDQAELQDPSSTTGRFGAALAFDALAGDIVAWPLAGAATATFSLETWVYPNALAGTRTLAITGDGSIAIKVTADTATTVKISATVMGSGGVAYTATSASVAANTWHWVLVSLQEPTLRLWVDGVRSETGNVRLSGTTLSLASLQLGGNYGGVLDEVWVSQGAITTEEAALQRYCPL